jgi:cytochrome P450
MSDTSNAAVATSCGLFVAAMATSLAFTARVDAVKNLPIPLTLPHLNHPIFGIALTIKNKIESLGTICIDNSDNNGLSCFYLLNQLCMGVTRAEDVKEVMQHETYREASQHMRKLLGSRSLLLMNRDEWKSHRKIITKAFKWEHLQEMVSDINSVSNTLVSVLLQKNGELLDIWQLMKTTTLEVIGLTAFGCKFGDLESSSGTSDIAQAVEFMNAEYNRREFESPLNIFSRLYFLPTPSNLAFNNAVRIYENRIKELIRLRRENIAAGKETHLDMMAYLLDAHDGDEGANSGTVKLNDEDLLGHLATIMGAGFETSSIALTYVFYMMATHPEVEAKALAEIKNVLGDDRMPTYEDLKTNLTYCNAIISEVLRLYPPIPLVGRWTKGPVTLSCGVSVPINTLCLMPIWWINRSAHHFDEPLKFRPERFLERDSKEIHRYAYIPFSGGPRDCVGRRFAMMELVAIFSIVIRKVKFAPKQGYELIPVPTGVAQKPKHGMPLWISKR